MKRIFILILLIVSFSCKAQTIYPLGTYDIVEDNYYVKDIENHHDDIVGVWKWEDGDDLFEITLEEFEAYQDFLVPTELQDRIFGKYKYIKDGDLVSEVVDVDTLPDFKLTLIYSSPTSYRVFIRDCVSETGKTGEFILISATTATLRLWNGEGVKVNYGNGLEWALPTDITLVKQ